MLISYDLMAVSGSRSSRDWRLGYGKRGGKSWWKETILIAEGTY
jgi:hypothetical protein